MPWVNATKLPNAALRKSRPFLSLNVLVTLLSFLKPHWFFKGGRLVNKLLMRSFEKSFGTASAFSMINAEVTKFV